MHRRTEGLNIGLQIERVGRAAIDTNVFAFVVQLRFAAGGAGQAREFTGFLSWPLLGGDHRLADADGQTAWVIG